LAERKSYWKPYAFGKKERYEYTYREKLGKEVRKGKVEFFIEKKGEEFELTVKGSYHKWKGSADFRFKSVKELAGWITMKMYFKHHWLIPLGKTLFSRGLVQVLLANRLEWTPSKEGKFHRKVKDCKIASFKGKLLEISRDSEVIFRLCVNRKIPLPLQLYKKTSEGDIFEITLVTYSGG